MIAFIATEKEKVGRFRD